MLMSLNERRMRRLLPMLRLMLGYLPLPTMRWLQSHRVARLPQGFRREKIRADGVPCEWLIPPDSPPDTVLLYLHGGGFVYGWTDMHRQMVTQLARLTGMRALAVDYRLAPEFPFPAALDDCTKVFRWLLKQGIAAQKIVIAGDSAGGNLTLTTLLRLRDSGDPLPAAAACLSPATDMTEREEIRQRYDPLLHPRALRSFRNAYILSRDPRDPLLSPVYADLRGLPPLLIHAGEDEVLCGDCVRLAERAQQAGVPARVEVYPRMWHVWQLNFPSVPQAAQALDDIGRFLKAHVGAA
ncbi:MAG: alpha/beta hydrolase [Chloroflexota bacterium]